MGRTGRKRSRKSSLNLNSLNGEEWVIDLNRFLVANGWRNDAKLFLKEFSVTGRGVGVLETVNPNDHLINMPYKLLITCTTVLESTDIKSICNGKLTIHDLLVLFVMLERVKGADSRWKAYLRSLPEVSPFLLFLELPLRKYQFLPLELRVICEKQYENYTSSRERVTKSIGMQHFSVFDGNLFKWAYVIVNTRAVYIDPQLVYEINLSKSLKTDDFLADAPSMALCPFLDMFNHHYGANTDANLVCNSSNNEFYYRLSSLNKICKYNQVFISYGSHDNIKLFLEYGFFIPDNKFDCVRFEFGQVLKVLRLMLNEREFKFVREHNCLENLYINTSGPSFQLKALLFIGFNESCRNYHSVIYGDEFENLNFNESLVQLLNHNLEIVITDSSTIKSACEDLHLLQDFLKYRENYVKTLINQFSQ